jgi:hypothetical protein
MAAINFFYSFSEALAEKKHNLGSDTLTVALTNSAPSLSNTVLADITEVTYTNLSTRAITTTSSSQSSGAYKLILTDLTLTSSGGTTGPFRYLVIYNDTATNDELIGYYDYGSSITLADGGGILLNFDGTNGFIALTLS